MHEHEQVIGVIRANTPAPVVHDPIRTVLLIVDMQRYFTQTGFPFTRVFEHLSPGSSAGYLQRVREHAIPSIQRLQTCFRAHDARIVFTAVGTDAGDGRELPPWLSALDELGLATIGQRMWPPVGDPGWQIDELLAPLPRETMLHDAAAGAPPADRGH